jgi:hypothetical protein
MGITTRRQVVLEPGEVEIEIAPTPRQPGDRRHAWGARSSGTACDGPALARHRWHGKSRRRAVPVARRPARREDGWPGLLQRRVRGARLPRAACATGPRRIVEPSRSETSGIWPRPSRRHLSPRPVPRSRFERLSSWIVSTGGCRVCAGGSAHQPLVMGVRHLPPAAGRATVVRPRAGRRVARVSPRRRGER